MLTLDEHTMCTRYNHVIEDTKEIIFICTMHVNICAIFQNLILCLFCSVKFLNELFGQAVIGLDIHLCSQ